MPPVLSYPGVYIQEISSGVRTITGVATSITAFVGRALRGPTDEPKRINSYSDFERYFGGLSRDCPMSYAVKQFYDNGGSAAIIVRLVNSAVNAEVSLPNGTDALVLEAASAGGWGDNIKIEVAHVSPDLFNLKVKDESTGSIETILNLSVSSSSSRAVDKVLPSESSLVRVKTMSSIRPDAISVAVALTGGADGSALTATQYEGSQSAKTGIYQLLKTDLFNLLCIPPIDFSNDVPNSTLQAAAILCNDRRAMLIVDPPSSATTKDTALTFINGQSIASGNAARNVAAFFPRIMVSDSLQEGRLDTFVPCGAVAGVIARTDSSRGIWKAPAGLDATLSGVTSLSYNLTDAENGELNPLGLNCLRSFPVYGRVVWGSRTMRGADQAADEYKYLAVRRVALYIEESLFRGTQWVVFEPNDAPLWAQIRLNIGAFMHNLFRQGAFQGSSPKDAYFVKCDGETTTQNDINLGVVNIIVGFAPLKPAEFVVLKLQQIAGNIQS